MKPYKLFNSNLKKILSEAEITVDAGTTGFEYEDEHFYLYAYINNTENELADISLMINGKTKEITEQQKQIVLNKLIEVRDNELAEIKEETEEHFNGDLHSYYGVTPQMFINLNY